MSIGKSTVSPYWKRNTRIINWADILIITAGSAVMLVTEIKFEN